MIFVSFIIWQHYKKKYASSNLLARNSYSDPSSRPEVEGGNVYFGVPVFSYSELEEATNNFDPEKELGDGGFGTVYHGKLHDGREVAVKRLYGHNYRRVEVFLNEVEILTRLHHKNLVSLYGCTSRHCHHKNLVSLYGCTSRHCRELLLVYEYIPNGTVADHIHGDRATTCSLTWPTRMSIAIETASALAYLHASDIVHRDIKTNNILLDDNFCVKVADFGLSRLFPNDVSHVSTAPQGTPGYVDPEYHQCYQLTSKSDVYSFGVVLIELISSLPAVDMFRQKHEINLANIAINKIEKCAFHELIDPHLGFESDNGVKMMTILVAKLAFQCLQQDKEMRPSMDEVLETLKKIQSGEDAPEDQEIAYDDAAILNVQQPASLDCDEFGLLKTKRLPPLPEAATDNWTSRSTTPNVSG
uniref:Protein kinase domain-containing protein n=1 Tax=Fagus sylvatica TaxID=28930 RepID=A0A2N9G6I2_FAGSY